MIAKLRKLTSGDISTWTTLKLGPQVVQVVVDSPVRELRQQSADLRRALLDLNRLRAGANAGSEDDDVLDGLDSDD